MTATDPDEIDYNNPPFPLTTIDRKILATRDEDYHRITWADLRDIVSKLTHHKPKKDPSLLTMQQKTTL